MWTSRRLTTRRTELRIKCTNSSAASRTSALTTVASNSGSAASSSTAVSSRRVALLLATRSPDRPAGGPAPPTTGAPGRRTAPRAWSRRTCRAPCRSISSRARSTRRQGLLDRACAACRTGRRGARLPTPAARPRATIASKRRVVDEAVVHAVDLAGAGRPGRHRDRDPDVRVVLARICAETVPLPTAVGPARTVSLGLGRRCAGSGAVLKLALERGDLVGAEPAHAARLGDAEPLHQVAGPDLAEPWDRPAAGRGPASCR